MRIRGTYACFQNVYVRECSQFSLVTGMYETENGRYGKSQRMKRLKLENPIDIDELKAHIDPHKSVYKTEYLPYSPSQLSSCNLGKFLLDDKNEDHMRVMKMRYPVQSTSREAFKDWSLSFGAPRPLSPSKVNVSDKCPFGVLSLSKLNTDTQYSNDFGNTSSNRAYARDRIHRSQSRDTFQYCQGGVPRESSNSSSRSRSLGPSHRHT